MKLTDSGLACFDRHRDKLTLKSSELAAFNLTLGKNRGTFRIPSFKAEIPFFVYLYQQDARFVITDIDGTITASDISGRIFPVLGIKANHEGIVKLYDKIADNGYNLVYLTARSLGEDLDTRRYLFQTLDNTDGGYSLPSGPLLMSPKSVTESIYEFVTSTTQGQKILTLTGIIDLFDDGVSVVRGAYGNNEGDETAYTTVGIPNEVVYIVNEESVVKNVGSGLTTTYDHHARDVDDLYPLISDD